MVEENKNKITIDLIKKMNEMSHRPKRIYEEPIIETCSEELEEEKEQLNESKIKKETDLKKNKKNELGMFEIIIIVIIVGMIPIVFSALLEKIFQYY